MASDNAAAVLGKASGSVYVERQGTRISLAEGDTIHATDKVVTDQRSTAEIHFNDGSTATLSPGTTLEVKDFSFGEGAQPSFILNLAEGTMRSVSGELVRQNPEAFKIVTPQATVGIRGTELFTAVMPGGQEVHAVLHIGKGHIVSITSHDGRSIVMDSALQAVNMSDGEHGALVKQTFQLNELQQVIKNIAPTQVQKPIQPQGVEGEAIPGQSDQSGQNDAAPAASTASTVVVIIHEGESATTAQIAAENTATGAAAAGTTETLLSAVEQLQGALADAGFTVAVTTESALQSGMTSSEVTQGKSVSDVLVSETVQDNVSQVIPKPELPEPTPPQPEAPPTVPEVPPSEPEIPPTDPDDPPTDPDDPPTDPDDPPTDPDDPPTDPDDPPTDPDDPPTDPDDPPTDPDDPPTDPDDPPTEPDPSEVTYADVTGRVVGADSASLQPGDHLNITVTGDVALGGWLMPNADNFTGQSTAGDSVTVNGTVHGFVFGDSHQALDEGGITPKTFGDDTITTGAVIGTMGTGDSAGRNVGGSVFGDVGSVKTATVTFGNDTITTGALSNKAQVIGDAGSVTANNAVCGDDTINVASINDGFVYGDVYDAWRAASGASSITFGNDTITVTGDVNGTIVGDVGTVENGLNCTYGKDTITVGSFSGGHIYGDTIATGDVGNDDTITVLGNMTDGIIHGAAGNDIISVGYTTANGVQTGTGTMSGGGIHAGIGDDVISVNALTGGIINGGPGNDSITVGSMGGGTIYGEFDTATSGGDDTILVQGNMSGGAIYGDALAVNIGGNDTIEVRGDMSGGTIIGGAGNDIIKVGITTTNGVETATGTLSSGTIDGGAGNDTMSTGSITVGGNNTVSIDGGTGTNTISTGVISTSGNATVLITGGGGTDTVTTGAITAAAGTTVRIDAGAGSDTITLGGYQGEGSLNINLGNDSVRDTLSFNASTIQGNITITGYNITSGQDANDDVISILGLNVPPTNYEFNSDGAFVIQLSDSSTITITGNFDSMGATDVYTRLTNGSGL